MVTKTKNHEEVAQEVSLEIYYGLADAGIKIPPEKSYQSGSIFFEMYNIVHDRYGDDAKAFVRDLKFCMSNLIKE
jgi:hypothetical protein